MLRNAKSEQLEERLRHTIPCPSGPAPTLAPNQSSCILGVYHKQLKELRTSLSKNVAPKKHSVKCFLDVADVIPKVQDSENSSLLERLHWFNEHTGDHDGIISQWLMLVLDRTKVRPLLSDEMQNHTLLKLDRIFGDTDFVTQLTTLLMSSQTIFAVRRILEILYRLASSYPQQGNIFNILHGIYPYCEYISKVSAMDSDSRFANLFSETRCEFISHLHSDHAKGCPVYDRECIKTAVLIAIKCLIDLKKLPEGMIQSENDDRTLQPCGILTKYLELFNGIERPDTLPELMVKMYGDNDASLIQVLLMLSENETQPDTAAELDIGVAVSQIDTTYKEILSCILSSFAENISVHSVFLYFLKSLSFDVGLLLDYLISPEVGTSFPTFFARWLGRVQADPSGLIPACATVTAKFRPGRTTLKRDKDEVAFQSTLTATGSSGV